MFFVSSEVFFSLDTTTKMLHRNFATARDVFQLYYDTSDGSFVFPFWVSFSFSFKIPVVDISSTRRYAIPTYGSRVIRLRLLTETDFTTPLSFETELVGDQAYYISIHHYDYDVWQSFQMFDDDMSPGTKSLSPLVRG